MNATPDTQNSLDTLIGVMAALRNPNGGCPWDLEQDYRSIVPHTIEEAYEVADAIERDDFDSLKDELGDLLFQVIFYARLAEEENRFNFTDVVSNLSEKLIRRHPHVFAENGSSSTEEVSVAWEQTKQEEREAKASSEQRQSSVLDDVPVGMPALSRAAKLQKRASRVGFDWKTVDGALEKIHEETVELNNAIHDGVNHDQAAIEHEIGDLLFSVVNVARFQKVDPERAMRYANQRFSRRFGWIEENLTAAGGNLESAMKSHSLEELATLWENAKAATT